MQTHDASVTATSRKQVTDLSLDQEHGAHRGRLCARTARTIRDRGIRSGTGFPPAGAPPGYVTRITVEKIVASEPGRADGPCSHRGAGKRCHHCTVSDNWILRIVVIRQLPTRVAAQPGKEFRLHVSLITHRDGSVEHPGNT